MKMVKTEIACRYRENVSLECNPFKSLLTISVHLKSNPRLSLKCTYHSQYIMSQNSQENMEAITQQSQSTTTVLPEVPEPT